MSDQEEWRDVVGYEGRYQVSNLGRIKSPAKVDARGSRLKERYLKSFRNRNGYATLTLWKDRVSENARVHRVVMEAFVGPCPEGHQTAHNNGNRTDNRLCNLRWASPKENASDRNGHGTENKGERNGQSKITGDQVLEVRKLSKAGIPQSSIASCIGVSQSAVSRIVTGRTWKHV